MKTLGRFGQLIAVMAVALAVPAPIVLFLGYLTIQTIRYTLYNL